MDGTNNMQFIEELALPFLLSLPEPLPDAAAERLQLKEGGTGGGERLYLDEGLDHVGTATSAYRSDSVYNWLLSRKRIRAWRR